MNDILLLFNYIIYSLLTCFIIDYGLILTTGTKVRWFKLHGCYNMVMVRCHSTEFYLKELALRR